MLGALAIVIAILIVLNHQDQQNSPNRTTNTVTETPGSPPAAPGEGPAETPGAAAPVKPDEPGQNRVSGPVDTASPSVMLHVSEQILR